MNRPAYRCSTKRDIREGLVGHKVRSVEFGDWDGQINGEGMARSIALHTSNGENVVITATSYGRLEVERA